jgi:DNA-binding transcriptional ArsR family regulator
MNSGVHATSDLLFRTLGDPTRRALFERLARGEPLTVQALTERAGVSQPAVSKHLGVLRRAGLVEAQPAGRETHYRARPGGLGPLLGWIEHCAAFWEERSETQDLPKRKTVAPEELGDPILYRIIDYFELIETLESGKLRVSSAANFSDRNELTGLILQTLDDPHFHPTTDAEMAHLVDQQQASLHSYFVSCWTETRDSIAMWELYSPSRSAVQVGVRKSVIQQAFHKHFQLSSFAKAHQTPPDDGQIYFYPPVVGPCEYTQFDRTLGAIQERYTEFNSRVGKLLEEGGDSFTKAYREFADAKSVVADSALLIKDAAYDFEREFRFILPAVTRNSLEYADCAARVFQILFAYHFRQLSNEDKIQNIYVDLDISNISEIYLDARCPPWTRATQARLLNEKGYSSEISSVYGRWLTQAELKPMKG